MYFYLPSILIWEPGFAGITYHAPLRQTVDPCWLGTGTGDRRAMSHPHPVHVGSVGPRFLGLHCFGDDGVLPREYSLSPKSETCTVEYAQHTPIEVTKLH
jgi:hypothetical protein